MLGGVVGKWSFNECISY